MKLQHFFLKAGLVLLGTCLFVLCQPNVLVANGLGCIAFVALVPFFVLASIVPLKTAPLWGGIYGAFAHLALVFWLFDFSPVAFFGIAFLYFCFFAVLTPILGLCTKAFGEKAFLTHWILYLAYEYLKTKGFFGFSYGVIGYSQWKFTALLPVASLFGVWGVSAIIIFPSAFLAAFVVRVINGKIEQSEVKQNFFGKFCCFLREKMLFIVGYVFIFGLSFLPFFMQPKLNGSVHKIALVQPNSDPWKSGTSNYVANLDVLMQLSNEAIAGQENLSLVVWPETAFVPRIKWHYRFRSDAEVFSLVTRLLDFLDEQNVPFIIGNDEAIYDAALAGTSDDLEAGRVDYNAALLFEPGRNTRPPTPEYYYKQHLVPLTESFPYKRILPFVYEALVSAGTPLYEAGSEAKVFDLAGLKFSVPICFEDNFGYLTRDFARNGCQLLINISNDAWSKSPVCQLQHLSTSVFRAAETGLPVLRATATGVTCYIDGHGKILQKLPPFQKGVLTVNCEVPEASNTLYTKIGDVLGWVFVCGSLAVLLVIAFNIIGWRHKDG